jgi:cobalt-zinc-cadmium efflux system outer membrane protein
VGPAGQLPDPELAIGIEDLPVTGPLAYSLNRDEFTMRKVGLQQTFPRQQKRALRSQRAADEVQLTGAERERAVLEVKRQTANAWIGAYVAEEILRRLRALEADFELQARTTTSGVASNRLTAVDSLAAQAALVQFRDRMRIAQLAVQQARAELARWVPDGADQPLATPPGFKELPLPREQLLTGVHHHASVLAYDAQLDAARTDVALARADKHADWRLELAYSNRARPYSDMVSLEFRVGLPVFASHRQDPVIAARNAQLHRVESEREAELRMHSAEIVRELANWETAQARLETYQHELVPLAEARVRAALAAFESAQTPIRPVLEARAAAVDVQVQALEILGLLGRAWAYLSYQQTSRSTP